MMLLPLLALGAVGHAVLWVALVNRIHGLGIRRRWVNLLTILCCLACALAPLAIGLALLPQLFGFEPRVASGVITAAWTYVTACAIVCILATIQRWQWQRHARRHGPVLSNHTSRINVADEVAAPLTPPGPSQWLSRIPGNEVFTICVQEKHITLARFASGHGELATGLNQSSEGLRIVHLSDFHMSGRIGKGYFERVVEEVNRCDADLVAITGDIIERSECLDWIPDTLARLRALAGVYFVLGNHDKHVGRDRLVAALRDAGLIYLGSTWRPITVRQTPLILAGNELPWFGPAADLSSVGQAFQPDTAARQAGKPDLPRPLRILLAHTPDQFGWAQANDIDLMLAGHNHGGQVCLPLLGPITAPSLHGVRYAAGTFRAGNTLLHVTRGVSSLTPLRWNCPPEVAVLNLGSPSAFV